MNKKMMIKVLYVISAVMILAGFGFVFVENTLPTWVPMICFVAATWINLGIIKADGKCFCKNK